MDCFSKNFAGRRVLVTGHTGFKGAWLAHWLLELGADVTGFALAPQANQPLCGWLDLPARLRHSAGDVNDLGAVRRVVADTTPEFVFHLAAQPLVRESYSIPVETFATNVVGTVHVLEAVRGLTTPCVTVVVTTDKCYENREWLHAYREEDPLGGYDPYSASKACAEIATAAYRRSFFPAAGNRLVASARAGNVIGGGDWAADRIVPDTIRALRENRPVPVRNRHATRPWQHVLEPLSGYLWLACELEQARRASDLPRRQALSAAFNFGPRLNSNRTVRELVEEVLRHWPGAWKDLTAPNQPHEAGRLNLAIEKAHHLLQWSPVWDFASTIEHTVSWYRATENASAEQVRAMTNRQLADFVRDAQGLGLAWSR